MAFANEEKNKTKVLVNVYAPLIDIIKHKMDAACLKRDAYLDKALFCEAELLRKDIKIPNSDRAKSYISDNLKQLHLKPLNLLLSQGTVDLMNDVCKEKNISRDVFINRFFLLLVSSDVVLSVLFQEAIRSLAEYYERNMPSCYVGKKESNVEFLSLENSYEEGTVSIEFYDGPCSFWNRDNILDTIEAFVTSSPFGRLRVLTETDNQLHSIAFKKDALDKLPEEYEFLKTKTAIGFNTFMSDQQVSDQEDFDEKLNQLINNKSEKDKLLSAIQKENQLRAERDSQKKSEKNNSTGKSS